MGKVNLMNNVEVELDKLINICHSNLSNSKKCLNYLQEERGLSRTVIDRFKIGYFPQNPNKLSNYISSTVLQKLSILDYSGNSQFSEYFYLIFPIFSEYKKPIGIGGRTLLSNEQREVFELPKYKNSSFKKANYLYGFDKSRSNILKNQNVYVVEGYFDHITLNSNGIRNSVAICGTAFSKNHMLKLARYTNKITFILDRDDGGQKAMHNIYEKYINKGIKLRFVLLPDNCKDVDDYFKQGGNREDFLTDLKYFIPNW